MRVCANCGTTWEKKADNYGAKKAKRHRSSGLGGTIITNDEMESGCGGETKITPPYSVAWRQRSVGICLNAI